MLRVTGPGRKSFASGLTQLGHLGRVNNLLAGKTAVAAVDAQGSQLFGANRRLQLGVGLGRRLGHPGITNLNLALG